MNLDSRPALAPHVHLRADPVADGMVLVYPEDLLGLNEESAAIVSRCDGRTSVAAMINSLLEEYDADPEELGHSVLEELQDLEQRGLMLADGPARPPSGPRGKRRALAGTR